MSETTAPTGGSNVINHNKQQELYVKRCNNVFEEMTKAGYKDIQLNIMEARVKDILEKGKETDTSGNSDDTSANNDKKRKVTLIIGGLPYKQVPFAPYINLLKTNPDLYAEKALKGKEKTQEQDQAKPTQDQQGR